MHAVYISSHDIHLAVQVGVEPLNTLIGNIQHTYAGVVNRANQQYGSLFKPHHYALLIQHRQWLVRLVHYIHWIHRLRSLAMDADEIGWSTDGAYRAHERQDSVTTSVVFNMLARGAGQDVQLKAYERVFDQPPKPEDVQLFNHGSPEDPRILGDPDFIRSIWQRGASPVRPRKRQAREQDVDAELLRVVELFRDLCLNQLTDRQAKAWNTVVTVDAIKSRSRKRPLPMVRALCVSALVTRGIATSSQAARFFGCGSGPVSAARRRYYESWFAECFGVSHDVVMKPRSAGLGDLQPGPVWRGLVAVQPGASGSADLLRRFMTGGVHRVPRGKISPSSDR